MRYTGHDESVDEYKVVWVICGSDGAVSDQSEVKVYNTRTHSWRRIGDFPCSCRLKDLGKFVNGKLHWIAYIAESIAWVVVLLDLGTERFGEVSEPDYRNGHFDGVLGVLSGWLCVLYLYDRTRADVWVMNEYGIRKYGPR
ncbi:F-box/kelch-repeat protein At3g06240-like [Actinidia eriantha]|uniref:F-box/kelch-repeat protein At3g06240-like n=1 Tax=Actinidia eriantha TaxID=165200 RepID=UPI002587E462|nr:F-box/kelch-repeat protein At3g06240-like [Actinidia eriantha]